MRPLALVACLVLLAAGCSGGDDGEERGGATTEEELTAQEIADRATAALEDVETFHFVYDVSGSERGGAGLVIQHAEGDVSRPDRVQADIVATFSGISIESELVVVDEESFLKDPLTGSWREITGVLDASAVFDPATGVVSIIEGARNLEFVGTQQIDGEPTYRLRGDVPARELTPLIGNPPSDELVPADLWVGADDFLVRRIVVHGPLFEGESDDVERTIDVTRYGDPVEIERPET